MTLPAETDRAKAPTSARGDWSDHTVQRANEMRFPALGVRIARLVDQWPDSLLRAAMARWRAARARHTRGVRSGVRP